MANKNKKQKAENKLNELKSMLTLKDNALNSAGNAIIITRKDGTIEWVNDGFVNLTGYSPEEAIGRNPRELVKSGMHDKAFYDEFWSTILSGNIWQGEFINRRKNGELYHEEETISPVFNAKNEITHFIGIKNDITHRKIVEKELIEAKEKAEQSNKLMQAFFANISHEFRTPLNGILGFLELLKDESLSSDEKNSFHEIIHQSSRRLTNTVDDIVFISSLDSGVVKIKKEKVELNTFLENYFNNYATINNQIDFSFNNCNEQIWLNTDPTRLTEVLDKILDNAFKFTEAGKIEFDVKQKESEVIFSVSDSGIGIASENFDLIFTRFWQVDKGFTRKYEGSGLGLYIAKKIVDLIDGKIWLDSVLNKGTTVYFSVPVFFEKDNDGEREESDVLLKNKIELNCEGKTILVAEDEFSNYIFLETVLKKYNCQVLQAKNGQEAIQTIDSGQKVDVILMDLKMPVTDGFEATKVIKGNRPEIPIIAQTAFAISNEKEKAKEAGCDGYLTKPIRIAELTKVLKELM